MSCLPPIDWSRPWFAPWQKWGERVAESVAQGASVAQALNAFNDRQNPTNLENNWNLTPIKTPIKPIRFVSQAALPAGQAYEDFIFNTRQVPTRDGLHDFFNGLCWYRFAQTKARLNALQFAEISRLGVGHIRGAVRDAITVFDENAVLLQCSDALWQALHERQWLRLFVDLRHEWERAHVILFGHALLEKLITPYKSITGHVYRLSNDFDAHDDAQVDAWLAQNLTPEKLASKPFAPLPVMGLPHWDDAQNPAFYADVQVFRPIRANVT